MSMEPTTPDLPENVDGDEDWDEVGSARISGYVILSEPTSCDVCGTNYDRLDWYYDANSIQISTSIGCYDGEQLSIADIDEAVAYFKSLGKRFPSARADLAEEAETMREKVTARRG